ncbi:MAG: M23 family metallopeptidase [Microthrixaceae bacterium]|nr:M23 family metallopeptidase [Microthrixaceae bacterium]
MARVLVVAALAALGVSGAPNTEVPVQVPAAGSARANRLAPRAVATGWASYSEPVTGPVRDRFRPPSSPYGPGNRGWDYGVTPGMEVRAAASGVVSFAGQVGGRLFVTVSHADGLRTSYSWLETVVVRAGSRVRGGEVIGTAGDTFHFGVRRGDSYLDPALLFGPRRARLVPTPPDG